MSKFMIKKGAIMKSFMPKVNHNFKFIKLISVEYEWTIRQRKAR